MTVIRINSNEKIQNEEATDSIRRAKTVSTRSSSQPASSSSLPLHQKVSSTEHPMIDRTISSEACMTDDDRLDDSKSRFKVAVSECVDELMKGQGYSRERAVKIILQKICPGDSQVNEEELFGLMSKYGIGPEDATRVLTISQTLHRTETEHSISPAQAVDSLIRKIQDSNFFSSVSNNNNDDDEKKKVSTCTSSNSSSPSTNRRSVKKNKETPLVVLSPPPRRSSRTKQSKFIKHIHTPTMKSPNGGSKKQFKKMSSSEVSSSGTGTSSPVNLSDSVVKKSVRKEDAVVRNNNNNNSKISNKRKRSSAVPHNKLVSSLEQVVLENPNKRSRTSSL
mmetsp:Transcript_213/g.260  ORF Transcript_213/g.260 Transcript_213/m.260 type:complete len:336 (-) Transcript_213:155-1162(-)